MDISVPLQSFEPIVIYLVLMAHYENLHHSKPFELRQRPKSRSLNEKLPLIRTDVVTNREPDLKAIICL